MIKNGWQFEQIGSDFSSGQNYFKMLMIDFSIRFNFEGRGRIKLYWANHNYWDSSADINSLHMYRNELLVSSLYGFNNWVGKELTLNDL